MAAKNDSTKSKKKGTSHRRQTAAHSSKVWGTSELLLIEAGNGKGHQRPDRHKPETKEEREKRLAARKALTLKAARIAYENHHRRKAS